MASQEYNKLPDDDRVDDDIDEFQEESGNIATPSRGDDVSAGSRPPLDAAEGMLINSR